MLSEADLQGLRGMAFDRLLLQVWPRFEYIRPKACHSCGSGPRTEGAPVVLALGLCGRCYGRWWRRQHGASSKTPKVVPGPQRSKPDIACEDALMAKRIGVSRISLEHWRNGTVVPKLTTIRRCLPGLEAEFGVPADLWLEALAISNFARGYALSRLGNRFVPQAPCRLVYPVPDRDEVGKQFGYWLVLSAVRRGPINPQGSKFPNRTKIVLSSRCLLCKSIHEIEIDQLRYRHGIACKACSLRLRRPGSGVSGLRGVHRHSNTGRWIVTRSITGSPYRSFSDATDAARYYDACMYERYGHTLFLNFPDEYDRSNDPVFVPV